MMNLSNRVYHLVFGDPNVLQTKKILQELATNGVKYIKVSIPFSDPIILGNKKALANIRALKNNIDTKLVFDVLKEFKENNQNIVLILNLFANTAFSYGYDNFFKDTKNSNIDYIDFNDLPIDEQDEINQFVKKYNVKLLNTIFYNGKDIKRVNEVLNLGFDLYYARSNEDGIKYLKNVVNKNIKLISDTKYTDIEEKETEILDLIEKFGDNAYLNLKTIL